MKISYINRTKGWGIFLSICLHLSKMATTVSYDDKILQQSSEEFTVDLFKQLPPDANIFFSPFSVSTALAMVHLGARDITRKEMTNVLKFEHLGEEVHAKIGAFLSKIMNERNVTLHSANRVYPNKKFPQNDGYLKDCTKHFQAPAEYVDFSMAEETRKTINDWVSKQTSNKIENLIPSGSFNALTFMVIVNAIYFKGNWESQFKEQHTMKMEFSNGKETILAEMMYQKETFRHMHDPDLMCNVLELPYKGKSLSMIIVLPMAVDGLSALEKKLSQHVLNKMLSGLHSKKVEVWLPKFKMEASFQLSPTLKAMGMKTAFDGNLADFSGMDKTKSIYISEVYHKAFIEVNEEGSEAAAATAIKMVKRSIQILPQFRADHPFAFFIRDNTSGVILFAGRLYKPEGEVVKEEL